MCSTCRKSSRLLSRSDSLGTVEVKEAEDGDRPAPSHRAVNTLWLTPSPSSGDSRQRYRYYRHSESPAFRRGQLLAKHIEIMEA